MGTQRLPVGWKALIEGDALSGESGGWRIPAYSEFIPPPRLARKPYGSMQPYLVSEDDPYGWRVSEMEEELELKPGLQRLAEVVVGALRLLAEGHAPRDLAGPLHRNLDGNPFWSPVLADVAEKLPHERYVTLLPLALSRTQDDKGRLRWTLFGCSEQGPERAFWKGFRSAPDRGTDGESAVSFVGRLLSQAYGESAGDAESLHRIGFRIAPSVDFAGFPYWRERPLPRWTERFLLQDGDSLDGVRYILTFRPFGSLPHQVRDAYLSGGVCLLPFPASLLFWGMPAAVRLSRVLPLGIQTALCPLVHRYERPGSIRVPQAGWLHEPGEKNVPLGIPDELLRNAFQRTSRYDRVHRDEDDLQFKMHEDKVVRVLFSTNLESLGLYGKPMARNCQVWTEDQRPILDGPRASPESIEAARALVHRGGHFGYRFLYPAMRIGRHEVYWHRPLVAFLSPNTGQVSTVENSPLGYLTAYSADSPDPSQPVELWPRLLRRPSYLSAVRNFRPSTDHRVLQTAYNILKLLRSWDALDRHPLPTGFARALLRLPRTESLESWLQSLPDKATTPSEGERMVAELKGILELRSSVAGPGSGTQSEAPPPAITYSKTATRLFERSYWNDIAALSQAEYANKNNADCVLDALSRRQQIHHHRDLESLGDYLLARHRNVIAAAGMEGMAVCGALPFSWQTDFDFPLFGGWKKNQPGRNRERNLMVVIPGRNRREAVVMADHYDTAYMEDVFDASLGGTGARLAAPGADDNCSATATLLRAAEVFLELARDGRLERDVWLLHLTGEEFPSDCLGARHFCQAVAAGALRLRLGQRRWLDLSKVRVVGVCLMDMIAHNREAEPYVFQISPGVGRESLRLACQAHLAAEAWNAGISEWNLTPARLRRGPGARSSDPNKVPAIAEHPRMYGDIRLPMEPQCTLYNTDGQIFSDIGIPVVLFMEDYDIKRDGYHDTKDTMGDIDLDYGAAVAAIAIETAARLAGGRPWLTADGS